jgi:hypothetical protein
MQLIKPLAVLFPFLACATVLSVSAIADDAKKDQARSQTRPSVSQSSAKSLGATRLDFDKADKDGDGKLSRAEYDAMLRGDDTSASAGASAKKENKAPSGTK